MQEFELISRYFKHASNSQQNASHAGVLLDKGDDCALLDVASLSSMAVTTDTLVAGVHFVDNMSPYAMAYRALATNLSDLAAMGATPKWFSLALTLPNVDETWLTQFSAGLFALADKHQIYLIGGDTTQGPLSITITAMGEVDKNKALRRNAAQLGDGIYVSGQLGDAAGALDFVLGKKQATNESHEHLLQRFEFPSARIKLGQKLIGVAKAGLDISDGLLADLSHILKASQLGAQLDIASLPLSKALLATYGLEQSRAFALGGGDDYELCFTASAANAKYIQDLAKDLKLPLTKIGCIVDSSSLNHGHSRDPRFPQISCFLDERAYSPKLKGFEHF